MAHNNRSQHDGPPSLHFNERDEQFDAYDILPKAIKLALQHALLDYAAPPQLERSQTYGVEWCVKNIAEADKRAVDQGHYDGIWDVKIDTGSKRFKQSLTKAVLALRGRRRRKNRRGDRT